MAEYAQPDVNSVAEKQIPAYNTTQGGELLYEAVADTGIFKRKSVTYILKSGNPTGQSVPNGFFVKYESIKHLVVHAGTDESGPVVGRVDMPTWRAARKAEFTMHPLPQQQQQQHGGAPPALTQQFERDGILKRTLSCSIPSLRASLGGGAGLFTWKSTNSHGAKWYRGHNMKLVDGDAADAAQPHAAYIRSGAFSGALGQLHVFGGAAQAPDAVAQIVVSCVALNEIVRREEQNRNAASSANAANINNINKINNLAS